MKRALLLYILLFPLLGYSTRFYVSNTGNDSNNGTSELTPWLTCNMVSFGHTFTAGDIVSFKRGDTWKEILYVTNSGSSGNPIVFNDYGTGNKPIISAVDELPGWTTSGNWTNSGSIWQITLSPAPPEIKRIWLNGTEVKKALSATVNATERFYYNTTTHVFYIYSATNPATTFTSITSGAVRQAAIYIYGSYLSLSNIDFQGGSNTSVRISDSDYLTFDGCNIGYQSDRCGIDANSTTAGTTVNNCEVKNCTFDVGAPTTFFYNYEDQSTLDCIRLSDGVDTWSIHNNEFKDWGHGALMIEGLTAGYASSNILFFNNYISCTNIYYGRGFGIVTNQGMGSGNKVYRNYFYDVTVNNQVGSAGCEVYYNIIDGNNRSSEIEAKPWQTGGGIEISNPYTVNVSGTKIWNNTIMNTHDAGIILSPYGAGTYNVTGVDITNNIIYNCGQSTRSGEYSLYEYDQQLGANTFRNNLIYKSGTLNVIYYGNSTTNTYPHAVDSFNAENGNGGDVIIGNVQLSPLFLTSPNFYLQFGSPAINAGFDVGLLIDYLGHSITGLPDIGVYEYIVVTPSVVIKPFGQGKRLWKF